MSNIDYKYISKNTLDLISLHDCFIDDVYIESTNLIWKTSDICILDSHPNNQFGKHMITADGYIIFNEFIILNAYKNYGVEYEAKTHKPVSEASIENFKDTNNAQTIIDIFQDLEILKFEKLSNQEDFQIYSFLAVKKAFIEFTIRFNEVTICWNMFR